MSFQSYSTQSHQVTTNPSHHDPDTESDLHGKEQEDRAVRHLSVHADLQGGLQGAGGAVTEGLAGTGGHRQAGRGPSDISDIRGCPQIP